MRCITRHCMLTVLRETSTTKWLGHNKLVTHTMTQAIPSHKSRTFACDQACSSANPAGFGCTGLATKRYAVAFRIVVAICAPQLTTFSGVENDFITCFFTLVDLQVVCACHIGYFQLALLRCRSHRVTMSGTYGNRHQSNMQKECLPAHACAPHHSHA